MDIIQKIKSNLNNFSKGQVRLGEYLTENYDKAAFMTAAKLGAKADVSESTVVRFAMALGFEGYPELQNALQELMRNSLTAVARVQVASSQIGEKGVLDSVLNLDIEKIKVTLAQTSRESFEKATDCILKAKHIYIIGSRSASPLASFLYYYLNIILPNVTLVSSAFASETLEQIMRVTEKDVVIGISFPRYSNNTVKVFDYAENHGAQIVGITDNESSPIARKSKHLLLVRSDMISFVDSLVAPLSLINALIVEIGLRKKQDLCDTFEKLEGIWDEYGIYNSSVGSGE